MEAALVFIALFAAAFGIMYVFYTTRHKERLALIEKGADATLFNTGKKEPWFSWGKFSLKLGMLAVGIAIGILAGALLSNSNIFPEEISFSSMIFLFGGLSLIFFYFTDKKLK
ncbi:MAG TPA: DUF6249 domain-containing protein [Bacteroidales bacterium]|nr:DUF6249 domain-containing protein [Bacteroidales bacterium]